MSYIISEPVYGFISEYVYEFMSEHISEQQYILVGIWVHIWVTAWVICEFTMSSLWAPKWGLNECLWGFTLLATLMVIYESTSMSLNESILESIYESIIFCSDPHRGTPCIALRIQWLTN